MKLSKHVDFLIGSGSSEGNMKLAKSIRDGVLDEQPLLRALVSMVVKKATKMSKGCKDRVTSATHDDIDAGSLRELAFTLSLNTSRDSILRFCGLNPRVLGIAYMDEPTLPSFFAPTQAVMVHNIQKVLQILDCKGGRSLAQDLFTDLFCLYLRHTLRHYLRTYLRLVLRLSMLPSKFPAWLSEVPPKMLPRKLDVHFR